MKKLLLTILLTLVSTSAMAEWTMIGTSGNNDTTTLYVDKSTITKKGSIVKMWSMMDELSPKEIDIATYLSLVTLREYDCVNQMSNLLKTTFYSENMMEGKAVISEDYNEKDWKHIIPDSITELNMKVACGKK